MMPSPLLLRREPAGGTPNCTTVDPQLPLSFQCAPDEYCLSVDTGNTAICCNDQVSCSELQPRSCDVQQMNATIHPHANIFTTRGDALPICGDLCCPFGYTCNAGNTGQSCFLDARYTPLSQVPSAAADASTLPAATSTTYSSTRTSQQVLTTTIPTTASTGASSTGVETLPTIITSSATESSGTPTPAPLHASNTSAAPGHGSLGARAKAGIGIGAGVGAIAVGAALAFFLFRRRKKYEAATQNSCDRQHQEIKEFQDHQPKENPPSVLRVSELQSDSKWSIPTSVELPVETHEDLPEDGRTGSFPRFYRSRL